MKEVYETPMSLAKALASELGITWKSHRRGPMGTTFFLYDEEGRKNNRWFDTACGAFVLSQLLAELYENKCGKKAPQFKQK